MGAVRRIAERLRFGDYPPEEDDEREREFLTMANTMQPKTCWWHATTWADLRARLFRSAGRSKFSDKPWARSMYQVWWQLRVKTRDRVMVRKLVKAMCDDDSFRAAIESAFRLNGPRGVIAMAREHFYPKPAPMTPEQKQARREQVRARARARREEHARAMLAKHERALRREERAVQRWGRKVAAYDRVRARETG